MRLNIHIRLESPLVLPLNYQEVLQGFIYNQIPDKTYSEFLHDHGYLYGKRKFKLFTFSRLMGQAKVDPRRKVIRFEEELNWQVSSSLPKFIQEFGQSLLTKDSFHLNGQPVIIDELHYETVSVNEPICTVRMLSPITVHSTFVSETGRKTTQYFSPHDPAFAHLIHENLAKKYVAHHGEPIKGIIRITPVRVSKRDKVVTRFKGFIIEAWNGLYQLEGDPKALTFACAVGLGGRNSSGFGMPELRR